MGGVMRSFANCFFFKKKKNQRFVCSKPFFFKAIMFHVYLIYFLNRFSFVGLRGAFCLVEEPGFERFFCLTKSAFRDFVSRLLKQIQGK